MSDRNERFLPQYNHYYQNSPRLVDFHGEIIDKDLRIVPVDDNGIEVKTDKDADIKHTIHMETITGSDGVPRTFDVGGKLPDGDGPIYMLASHDESCAKAGEYSDRAWAHKDDKQVCRDTRALASHRLSYVLGGMVSPCLFFSFLSFRLIAPLAPYCDRGNVKITRDRPDDAKPS